MRLCSVPGCGRKHECRGFCNAHYLRWKAGKDLDVPLQAAPIPKTNPCLVEGCTSPVKQNGYCGRHFKSWYRHGDPLKAQPRQPDGSGTQRKDGYIQVVHEGKRVGQHRVVWQEAHGPIPTGYHVHHINHVRNDNRLENLELVRNTEHPTKDFPKAVSGWSRDHEDCQDCGTTERPHFAKGLCEVCYFRRRRSV